jgi:PBP4 family serine-type D-alanyl-D-alanine carboxypeptidase
MVKNRITHFFSKSFKLYPILIYCIFAFSCSSTLNYSIKKKRRYFQKNIALILEEANLNATIGIKIVSLENSKTLYELNSKRLLIPASNMKLLTFASALESLGPEYFFKTIIGKDKENIVLIGGGDPTLTSYNLDSLARVISIDKTNIDTLFINTSILDTLDYGMGWMWDEGSDEFSAPISAITVDNNCITFEYSPSEMGEPAQINFSSYSNLISIENQSITVNDTVDYDPFRIDRDWVNQTNKFIISGEVLREAIPDTLKKNIYNPRNYNAELFEHFLSSHGVKTNHIKFSNVEKKIDTLIVHESKPFGAVSKKMMFESNNQIAELLLRKIGYKAFGIGSSQSGSKAIKSFLFNKVNIDTNFLRIADGSGLSRYNLLSADQIVNLLVYMNENHFTEYFKNKLPNGGSKNSGLEDRLVNTGDNVIAKTGSLSGVSTLSGYINSEEHGPLAFSILINGFTGSLEPLREFQNQLCRWLVKG